MIGCLLFTAIVACPLVCVGAIAANNVPSTGLPGGYAPAKLTEDVKIAAEFAVQEGQTRSCSVEAGEYFQSGKTNRCRCQLSVSPYGESEWIDTGRKSCCLSEPKSRYRLTSWEWLGD